MYRPYTICSSGSILRMQGTCTQYVTKRSILCRGAFCGPTMRNSVHSTVQACLRSYYFTKRVCATQLTSANLLALHVLSSANLHMYPTQLFYKFACATELFYKLACASQLFYRRACASQVSYKLFSWQMSFICTSAVFHDNSHSSIPVSVEYSCTMETTMGQKRYPVGHWSTDSILPKLAVVYFLRKSVELDQLVLMVPTDQDPQG